MAKFTINKDLVVGDTNYSLGDIPFGELPEVPSGTNYCKIGNIMIVWGNRSVTLSWNGNDGQASFDLASDGTPFLNTNYRIVGSMTNGGAYFANGHYRYQGDTTTKGKIYCWCEAGVKPTSVLNFTFIAIGSWRNPK